jgi:hypothetical protein
LQHSEAGRCANRVEDDITANLFQVQAIHQGDEALGRLLHPSRRKIGTQQIIHFVRREDGRLLGTVAIFRFVAAEIADGSEPREDRECQAQAKGFPSLGRTLHGTLGMSDDVAVGSMPIIATD